MKNNQAVHVMDAILQNHTSSQTSSDPESKTETLKEIDWRAHNHEKIYGTAEQFSDIPQIMRELLNKI